MRARVRGGGDPKNLAGPVSLCEIPGFYRLVMTKPIFDPNVEIFASQNFENFKVTRVGESVSEENEMMSPAFGGAKEKGAGPVSGTFCPWAKVPRIS